MFDPAYTKDYAQRGGKPPLKPDNDDWSEDLAKLALILGWVYLIIELNFLSYPFAPWVLGPIFIYNVFVGFYIVKRRDMSTTNILLTIIAVATTYFGGVLAGLSLWVLERMTRPPRPLA